MDSNGKINKRTKQLFNIPINSQKPNIGPVTISADLKNRLQNFLSESEKIPMPENAEENKFIEFVNTDKEEGNTDDDTSDSDSEQEKESSDVIDIPKDVVMDLYVPKDDNKEILLIEELDDK
uniref:Uncharacterized protein n=1 Tax=Parastrongyloides trichosuri TaxID=131310 RepID=A0A0N4ZUR6_PARTI